MIASAAVVVIAASSLIAFALNSSGYTVHVPELNDGGVWVTRSAAGDVANSSFGRFNRPINQLDTAFYGLGQPSSYLDVVQQGSDVVGFDRGSGAIEPIDPATGQVLTSNPSTVPAGSELVLNGGTLAALDPSSGRLWATSDKATGSLVATKVDATDKSAALKGVGANAAMTVTADGTIFVISAQSQRYTEYRVNGDKFTVAHVGAIGTSVSPAVELTAVGNTVVAFDPMNSLLFVVGGKQLAYPGNDPTATIQDLGPESSDVVIATSRQLSAVPLDGGSARTLSSVGTGRPVPPAVLPGGCVEGAWSGSTSVYLESCGGAVVTTGTQLRDSDGNSVVISKNTRWRVNRGYAVLNDPEDGSLWTKDSKGKQLADWASVLPQANPNPGRKGSHDEAAANQAQPPKAVNDTEFVRTGRTAVLHVLDNDSNPAGGIIAVAGIPSPPKQSGVTAQIAPDGQSIRFAMPAEQHGDVQFTYTIKSDSNRLSEPATVTVKAADDNPAVDKAPLIRPGYKNPAVSVVEKGTVSLAVLGDWRDPENDPVTLVGASNGTVITSDGQMRFTAPAKAGKVSLNYSVTDGLGKATQRSLPITVLDPDSQTVIASTAEPDVTLATVGRPVTIYPLSNDLAGVDPSAPGSSSLMLASAVTSVAGTTVTTDRQTGAVTIVPHRAQTFHIPYSIEVTGGARTSTGTIRVDATTASSPRPPVAMPDTVTVHGVNPGIADVLANDYDPQGDVLVVQHAEAADPTTRVQLAIIQGQFINVVNARGQTSGSTVVRYTVTDGEQFSIGELTVNFVSALGDGDRPLPTNDTADVRAGDVVTIPVLDNDVDPDGATLELDPALLQPVGFRVGLAVVSGHTIRFGAPAVATKDETATWQYGVRSGATGQLSIAQVTVHIHALTADAAKTDRYPVPATVTANVVSGDTVTIKLPTTRVDPDGDSVSVLGIAPAPESNALPALGRILASTATSITYQAFPTSQGTDTFGYLVADNFGKTAVGQIDVGVVPAGDPQPPVGVADDIVAAPGRTVTIFPLSNDLVAPDDTVSMVNFGSDDEGFSVNGNAVTLKAVPGAKSPPVTAHYTLRSGSTGNALGATDIVVAPQEGYDNPPTAVDDNVPPADVGKIVTIKPLANDRDIDNPASDLRIVAAAKGTASAPVMFTATEVHVTVGSDPQTIWYAVSDGKIETIGVIHVPPAGAGPPTLRKDAPAITVVDKPYELALNKFVTDPAGKAVKLAETVQTAPSDGLSWKAPKGTNTIVLTRKNNYTGPASVTFEVVETTPSSAAGALSAFLTVPVQVGTPTPVLRCPTSAGLSIIAGNKTPPTPRDLVSLCHIWVPENHGIDDFHFTVEWSGTPIRSVMPSISGHSLQVRAGSDAATAQGVLKIKVVGQPYQATGDTVHVAITQPGPPRIRPIVIPGAPVGQETKIDVSAYLESDRESPKFTVVNFSFEHGFGDPPRTRFAGSDIFITPAHNAHGPLMFAITVSDYADMHRTQAQVSGTVLLDVLGVPATPTNVQAVDAPDDPDGALITWDKLEFTGGSPTHFVVRSNPPTGEQACGANNCEVHNLVFGHSYTFQVQAVNAQGTQNPPNDWSRSSASYARHGNPPQLEVPTTSAPGNGTITVSWVDPADDNGHKYNKITSYRVFATAVANGDTGTGVNEEFTVPAPTTSIVVGSGAYGPKLVNDTRYTFAVQAFSKDVADNKNLPGTTSDASAETYPQGPSLPVQAAPTVTGQPSADGSSTTATITWHPADPNGDPNPLIYTVYAARNGGSLVPACRQVASPTVTCDYRNLSTTGGDHYAFTVTAANKGGVESTKSPQSVPFEAAGRPVGFNASDITLTPDASADGALTVGFTSHDAHGSSATVECVVSNGGPCGSWSVSPTGTTTTKPITGLGANQDYSVQLRLCNSDNDLGADRCSAYTTSPTAHTYGPASAPSVSCRLDVTTITWSWSAPAARSGQRPITGFQYSVDGGAFSGTTGATSYSNSWGQDGSSHNVVVRAMDAVEAGTQSPAVTCTEPNPPPPPNPTVTVSRGAPCGGGGGAACQGKAPCSSSSCAYIHVVTANFPGSVSCTFDSDNGKVGFVQNISWGANEGKDSPNYYGFPGTKVYVTCGNIPGSMVW